MSHSHFAEWIFTLNAPECQLASSSEQAKFLHFEATKIGAIYSYYIFPFTPQPKFMKDLFFIFLSHKKYCFFTEFVLEQENIFSLVCRIALEIKKAKK